MRRDSFDLIFVDMDLGDMEGTTLVATAKDCFRAKIVFATAYSQYAAKAYEMEIDDYILKPFGPERVHHVVKKCIGEGKCDSAEKWRSRRKKRNRQQQKTGGRAGKTQVWKRGAKQWYSARSPVTASRGIPVSGDRPDRVCGDRRTRGVVHTTSRSYEVNQLLGELEKKLADFGFFRIHKSYLINLSFISELFSRQRKRTFRTYEGYESRELPVGREKLKTLKQLLKIS